MSNETTNNVIGNEVMVNEGENNMETTQVTEAAVVETTEEIAVTEAAVVETTEEIAVTETAVVETTEEIAVTETAAVETIKEIIESIKAEENETTEEETTTVPTEMKLPKYLLNNITTLRNSLVANDKKFKNIVMSIIKMTLTSDELKEIATNPEKISEYVERFQQDNIELCEDIFNISIPLEDAIIKYTEVYKKTYLENKKTMSKVGVPRIKRDIEGLKKEHMELALTNSQKENPILDNSLIALKLYNEKAYNWERDIYTMAIKKSLKQLNNIEEFDNLVNTIPEEVMQNEELALKLTLIVDSSKGVVESREKRRLKEAEIKMKKTQKAKSLLTAKVEAKNKQVTNITLPKPTEENKTEAKAEVPSAASEFIKSQEVDYGNLVDIFTGDDE